MSGRLVGGALFTLASLFASRFAAAQIPVSPDREAFYGDLHLHTSYSLDAYLAFGAEIGPAGAYRFARGEPQKYLDEPMKRASPPLDFLAVTDHAELLGVVNTLDDPASTLSHSAIGQALRRRDPAAFRKLGQWPNQVNAVPEVDMQAIARSAWQREIDAANRHYEPGRFTTFIAYEWTSMPGGSHLHRNVIFRGDKAPNPFTAADSSKPEDLWRWLEKIRSQGYEALAIPHNPNASDGRTFDRLDSEGRPIDRAYAGRRASNEPLVEIAQNKGQSETFPALSPNDEFASFEVMDRSGGHTYKPEGSYVRDALGRGLEIARRDGGVNPFKYGFVGVAP